MNTCFYKNKKQKQTNKQTNTKQKQTNKQKTQSTNKRTNKQKQPINKPNQRYTINKQTKPTIHFIQVNIIIFVTCQSAFL